MKTKKLKQSGIMLASLIIIISFVYAIHIQPVVIGKQDLVRTDSTTQDTVKIQTSNIYKLSLENGFEYKCKIKQLNNDEILDNNYCFYWGHYSHSFVRSYYIKNVLTAISSNMIKIDSLSNLNELNFLQLIS
jgi:hypothetical protein